MLRYIFCCKEKSDDALEKMFKEWFQIFQHLELFKLAMAEYTREHGLLVLYTGQKKSDALKDNVFWFVATHIEPDFTVGNREYWRLHELFWKGRRSTLFNWKKYRKEIKASEDNYGKPQQADTRLSLFVRYDEDGYPLDDED
jgi:hypothetical protein